MSGTLSIRNRQRTIPVDVRSLRRITLVLLRDLLAKEAFELGICLVRLPEMTRLNETFLRHNGPTDVITFDYSDPGYGVPGPGSRGPHDEVRARRGRRKLETRQSKPRSSLHGLSPNRIPDDGAGS